MWNRRQSWSVELTEPVCTASFWMSFFFSSSISSRSGFDSSFWRLFSVVSSGLRTNSAGVAGILFRSSKINQGDLVSCLLIKYFSHLPRSLIWRWYSSLLELTIECTSSRKILLVFIKSLYDPWSTISPWETTIISSHLCRCDIPCVTKRRVYSKDKIYPPAHWFIYVYFAI